MAVRAKTRYDLATRKPQATGCFCALFMLPAVSWQKMALLETECEGKKNETLLMLRFMFTWLSLPFQGGFSVFVCV